ncbi:prepilin-type N-terminal cleavage/methylation domain-containing protein [Cellulomonas bogoriensis]|uniref:Prepilin-type N-terminal cleavage/methylation domain-containing protein n=1 Tax=Cellulomonas bogoriensis 69B4 = DSM 16987 TaxID=1386082 RepID=A0A0A0C276_9CELL|nr:prepilin-type N-terminal cleavage/methylation domain-containing protein [Cellulomonas bogoriensis]KGM14260.1 hypothetical protein N869_00750 [Cellulomonas bogoriensis 69B4 = DSM 16987]
MRKRLYQSSDEGLTLVEVMVAMFIFALVSSGVIYTMLSVMTIGRDSRARQVATHLAAEAVDRAREEEDLFDLLDTTYTRELNGDVFTVSRSTAWISDPDEDIVCGGGGGQLRYKRVNVEVSWENMRAGSVPARADTVIDPKTRINDPTRGTLLVSVLNGAGEGAGGVTVTAQRTNAAGSPVGSALPAVTTDAQGCAFILRVEPGSYRVSISRPGYRDVTNVENPTTSTAVSAGTSASVSFNYDAAATYRVTYAEGAEPTPSVARTMPTTFLSTYGIVEPTAPTGTNPRNFSAFPFASGYDVIAGRYRAPIEGVSEGCLSPDPAAWPGGARSEALAGGPGETVTGPVRTGLVTVTVTPGTTGSRFIRAVSVGSPPPGTEDPGCSEGYEFIFNPAPIDGDGNAVLALPYGSWQLYRGTSSNPSTLITSGQMAPMSRGTVTGNVLTLDPRSS